MTEPYFSNKSFKFLRALTRNNSREWFSEHKADYEAYLRTPFVRLITDLQPDLLTISDQFRADPRLVGGSLFRIHRDTRFSNNKLPYKTWSGARFYHECTKSAPSSSSIVATGQHRPTPVDAPSFYLHIEPGECFIGAGIWHPEPVSQRRIRQFIFENPESWKTRMQSAAFRRHFSMGGDSLVRPPRGYPADHLLIDDLKRKDFVAVAKLDDDVVLGNRLRESVAKQFSELAPLVDYLCAALDLAF